MAYVQAGLPQGSAPRALHAGRPARGPYLTSLQSLSLVGNSLDRLPAALAGASGADSLIVSKGLHNSVFLIAFRTFVGDQYKRVF